MRYPGATGMKTGFICASGYNLVASAKRGTREVIAVVFGAIPGGKARTERAAKLLDDGFGSPPPPEGETFATLDEVKSSETYDGPMDMRPYVCGRKARQGGVGIGRFRRRRRGGRLAPDRRAARSRAAGQGLGPGPARLRRPGLRGAASASAAGTGIAAPDADVLNAYAPGDEAGDGSGPADAIGAAAGNPRPLDSVAPQ